MFVNMLDPSCVPCYLILPLFLLLLLEFPLCHAVLPLNPVQLLIQSALVSTRSTVTHVLKGLKA